MLIKNKIAVSILAAFLVSNFSEAATKHVLICPNKIKYGMNQEGTLKIYAPNNLMTAKVLPEVEYGFAGLNINLTYKVSNEAIAGMKSTLDIASSMMRVVQVDYDDEKYVEIGGGERGFQIWAIYGPLSKSKVQSKNCVEK